MSFDTVINAMAGYPIIDLKSEHIKSLSYSSSSRGNQKKYYNCRTKEYIKSQFECQGKYWKDYMVEYLSYIIGSQINSKTSVLKQDVVLLSNNLYGCKSKDFAVGSQYVPFYKFGDYKVISRMIGKSYKVFKSILDEYTKLEIDKEDVIDYISTTIILDFLLCNEDRHFNNFGLLFDSKNNKYTLPPIFDCGLGLFEHDIKYQNKSLVEAKQLLDCKPFDCNPRNAFDMITNVLGKSCIKKMCKSITIPSRALFPNELGYEYFVESYNYMRSVTA